MYLQNVLIFLLLFLVIGSFLLWSIKSANLFPINDTDSVVQLESFQMTIPACWNKIETDHKNELIFTRGDSTNSWKAFIRSTQEDLELPLVDIFKKYIDERIINFDDENLVDFNPRIFQESPIIKNGRFELARIEGTSTVDKEDRSYCDIVVFRNLDSGMCLYAESRGPVLNGFFEAHYFEDVLLRLEFNDKIVN